MSGSRLRRPPGALAVLLGLAVGAAGTVGVVTSAQDRSDEVQRVEDMADVLAANDGPAENYLLVGSDSRENVDGDAENADQVGTADDVVGRRSDTIMILRREEGGGAYLLSIPRDLWVEIDGTDGEEGKINSAYNEGPRRLAATITDSLGIPIHHYVEVDFVGFTSMVDEVGGVEMCFMYATRDTHSGLDVQPGCHRLDGTQALAYTRSRYYQEFRDGDWVDVGGSDLGRIGRQQMFIRQAVTQVLQELEGNLFRVDELISAAGSAVRIDAGSNPLQSANALRAAAGAGLRTYTLPVELLEIDDVSALELGDGADSVLDFFRGTGPAPPEPAPPETTIAD